MSDVVEKGRRAWPQAECRSGGSVREACRVSPYFCNRLPDLITTGSNCRNMTCVLVTVW